MPASVGFDVQALKHVRIVRLECLAFGTNSHVLPPDIARRDLSAEVDEAMACIAASWAYLNVCGDVGDMLERIARALEADVIVVGRPARPRMRTAHSVARRLLGTTRHVVVVV